MTSILCGLAAACCWANANLIATRIARGPDPRQLAFWFNLLGCALCLPLGLAQLFTTHISIGDLLWLALVGAGTAATMRLLTLALTHGRLGVVGPLLSLEGAFAAAIALVVLGRVSGLVLAGIAVSVLGSVTVAFGAARRGHLAGSSYALPAATCAGVVLWALAHQTLAPILALMIARAVGAIVLAPTVPAWRLPPNMRWLVVVAAMDITGNALFIVGAHAGSLPATAVLAAQFGTLTALAGIWRLKESLTVPQVVGLLILGVGVAVIAAAG